MIFAILKKSSKFGVLFLFLSSLFPVSFGNCGDQSGVALAKPEVLSTPIEIEASIPPEDAGIINFARVPDDTGFAVLIRSAFGLDVHSADAIRFTIDDGLHVPYRRDPSFDTVRVVKLDEAPDEQATFLWAVYDRFLEPFMPAAYPPGRVISIKVEISDIRNNVLRPDAFEFKTESPAEKTASLQNLPKTRAFYARDPFSEYVQGAEVEVTEGKLRGAKVVYSSLEPLTPQFGSLNAIEEINLEGIRVAGAPVNLMPHSVFNTPVTLFLPLSEDVDIRTVGLAYYDGTQWMLAADADGNMLSGAEGWMVPGSRFNHEQSSPPLIEVQVYHFSAAQAVVFTTPGTTLDDEQDKDQNGGANVVVFASCFISSASSDAGLAFWFLSFFAGIIILLGFRHQATGIGHQVEKCKV